MNAYPSETFQNWFFKQLEQKFDKRGKMVYAICNSLNLGRDAIYRRLRGDTALTAEEMLTLAREFDIQLNNPETCPNSRQQIDYPNGVNQVNNELEYYQQLEEQYTEVLQLKGLEIDYASPELPFYYEFSTPTLLAFKTYIYGLTSWNFNKWREVTFRPELIDPKMFEITDRLMPLLFNVPGRDLWSVGILDVTLRQIEHAVDMLHHIFDRARRGGPIERPGVGNEDVRRSRIDHQTHGTHGGKQEKVPTRAGSQGK